MHHDTDHSIATVSLVASLRFLKLAIRTLVTVNGIALALTVLILADGLKDGCSLHHTQFLYWFLVSLLLAMLCPFFAHLSQDDLTASIRLKTEKSNTGGQARHFGRLGISLHKLVLVLGLFSLLSFAMGGEKFITEFTRNVLIDCPTDSDTYDLQQYNT